MRLFKALAVLSALSLTGAAAGAQTSKYGIPSTSGSGGVQLTVSTVAGLPTCDVSHIGIVRYVTDATGLTYNGTATAGGSTGASVVCNGTAWKSQ